MMMLEKGHLLREALQALCPQATYHTEGQRQVVVVPRSSLSDACVEVQRCVPGITLLTMVGSDRGPEPGNMTGERYTLRYVFSLPDDQLVEIQAGIPEDDPSFPSVTPLLPAAHWYEREVRDLLGLVPIGHPDPRRLVFHDTWPHGYHPLRKDVDGTIPPPLVDERDFPFVPMQGEGISIVPVGPIHAGIIEPGHFRFAVSGEHIFHLEARLFFVHRGIEKMCEGKPIDTVLDVAERICGVCSFAHGLAYCQAVEDATEMGVPPRARYLRLICGELERIYNHIGDTGNICAGVGLAVGTMLGARLKEETQRLAEILCGSRYLRGIVQPGGVRISPSRATLQELSQRLARIREEFLRLEDLLLNTESFLRRLGGTGRLSLLAATDLGAVGVAARASGVPRDIRLAHPYAAYGIHPPHLVTTSSGDVLARLWVRLQETRDAFRLIDEAVANLPDGDVWMPVDPARLAAGRHGIGWAESPRGEHVHWVTLGPDGTIDRLRVRAASYCNWPVVPLAVPGAMVPDFPLINKSFELCYSCLDR